MLPRWLGPGGSVAQPCTRPTRAASATALKNACDKACLQVGDLATEVELELAGGPKAAFTGFGHLLECCRRPQEPAEGRLRRLKRDLVGQAVLIEDRLGGIQRLAIE